MGWLLDFGKRRIVGLIVSWVTFAFIFIILLALASGDGDPVTQDQRNAIWIVAFAMATLNSLRYTSRMKRRQEHRRAIKEARKRAMMARPRPFIPRRLFLGKVIKPGLPANRRWPYAFKPRGPYRPPGPRSGP